MFCNQVFTFFADGVTTVKDDAANIKNDVVSLKVTWEKSGIHTTICEQIRLIKEGFPHGILNGE